MTCLRMFSSLAWVLGVEESGIAVIRKSKVKSLATDALSAIDTFTILG